jgi:two-component system nitrogen regulation response regulator GlnG
MSVASTTPLSAASSEEPRPAAVLLIDDDRSVHLLVSRALEPTGLRVSAVTTAEEGLAVLEKLQPEVVLLDIVLPEINGLELFRKLRALDPRVPVVFITAGGTSDTAIEAMKLGAYDYLLKPLDLAKVRELVERAVENQRLMRTPVEVPRPDVTELAGDRLVGRSTAMQEVYKAIGRVAPQDVTVLIRGESGTGKELVARAIYHHSKRAGGPFLAVNCAAIPEQLLESELFGHEKGAFTSAERRRIGKFEQCSGGSIFLDEVGDMSPMVQSKMLRLLQEQRFERVGGNETIQTDVRIITATNRDLEKMVADGDFREDLYYRLNGFTIMLPPLRARGEDLPLLIYHFLERLRREFGKDIQGLSSASLQTLLNYNWPGNVRELQSVLRQALLQTTESIIFPEALPRLVAESATAVSAAPSTDAAAAVESAGELQSYIEQRLREGSQSLHAEATDMMERYLLTRVLRQTEGNQSEAARILGITRGSLRNKIRSLGISIGQVVTVDDGNDDD